MPTMSGPELAEQLLAIRPGLKVLLMSGYASEAVSPWSDECPLVSFLQKPFSVESLCAKVREALAAVPLRH
jgi:DNA-binding NtrC family response regulator